MRITVYLYTFALLVTSLSCLKPSQSEMDDDTILNYLQDHNLTAIKHNTGLYYIIKNEGSGANPIGTDSVTVHYKGFLTGGQQFDGTTTTPRTFLLGQLITGWQIGIPLIKKGGDIQLFVPSALGYGNNAVGSIPPNSVLIFEIQLINIK